MIEFKVTNATADQIETGCLIIGVFRDTKVSSQWPELDAASDGLLTSLEAAGEFNLGTGSTVMLHRPAEIKARRILVVGLGTKKRFDDSAFVRCAQAAGKALRQSRATNAHCLLPGIELKPRDATWKALQTALALDHADYIYSQTKKPEAHAAPTTDSVTLPDFDNSEATIKHAHALAQGVRQCRLLGDLPPNICTPKHLAETARTLAKEIDGLEVDVLDEDEMESIGMHSLLAVGRGSVNRPYLIRLRWRGGSPDQAPTALVGKGVTFDTGGISIKPRELMEQMKFDMCGAATTIGVLEAVARMKLPINVDGVVAAVENMPDGNAYRPGDIVDTLAGKTIEVHNTDAEGRMILADALTWTARESKPAAMVDIATLTGACVVALGHHASAIMTRDDELAEDLLAAGLESADRGWRLPLWPEYQQQLDSPFADMKNIGGMPAGSITAGCFLSNFVEDCRWAHIDIAGSAWRWGKAESASGRPVGMLVQWLINRAQQN